MFSNLLRSEKGSSFVINDTRMKDPMPEKPQGFKLGPEMLTPQNKLPKVVVLFLREKVECYVQQEKKIAYHEGKVPLDVPIMVKPGCWRENLGESKGNMISFTTPLWLSFTDNPDVPA